MLSLAAKRRSGMPRVPVLESRRCSNLDPADQEASTLPVSYLVVEKGQEFRHLPKC